jgi:hypothetical protein
MSRKRSHRRTPPSSAEPAAPAKEVPPPVDLVDGVPDHAPRASRLRLPIIVIVFAAWAAFLVYCLLAARVN